MVPVQARVSALCPAIRTQIHTALGAQSKRELHPLGVQDKAAVGCLAHNCLPAALTVCVCVRWGGGRRVATLQHGEPTSGHAIIVCLLMQSSVVVSAGSWREHVKVCPQPPSHLLSHARRPTKRMCVPCAGPSHPQRRARAPLMIKHGHGPAVCPWPRRFGPSLVAHALHP